MSLSPLQLQAKAELERRRRTKTTTPIWTPDPRNVPQQQAYICEADILYYGGAAGGGKTDLALGLAFTAHQRSIIFRREYTQLQAIIERGDEIADAIGISYVAGEKKWWRLGPNRFVRLAAMQREDDKQKFKGRPHDLYVFDEAPDFTRSQIEFVIAWNRTTDPGQRCRVVLTGNPPTDSEGAWIIDMFAPWLDERHPNPAAPGELRWFIKVGNEDVEVDGPEPVDTEGETRYPKSRTFIPAKVEDNWYLTQDTAYLATLDQLPEPLRSAYRHGLFNIQSQDHEWQVIPTEWIRLAQERWRQTEKPDVALRAAAVDVARGGPDRTTIGKIYGTWIAPIIERPGSSTPDGPAVAREVLKALHGESAAVGIDAIGVGSSPYDVLKQLTALDVIPINFSETPPKRFGLEPTDKSRKYRFSNVRSMAYWQFAEALNPENGQNIALPPGRQLRIELAAPRYQIVGGKIKLEKKDDIKERIGRSPDLADVIVMLWYVANKPVYTPGGNLND